jgi:uncharacterized protein DUF1841
MSSAGPFGGHTRDELRRSYADAWRKHLERAPLTPLESLIADVIALHPEYQVLMRDADAARDFESGGGPAENPFLHMGLHLAVREQISIDRPPGVRELERALAVRLGDRHAAEHALMESLAETLWEAQRSGRAPDEREYLERARRRLPAK